ncbi:MAG: ABC transporter permease, partial [Candidatus Aminicenantes bacterium]|nr:ABC transporter permease [Candidatus Aminicenantes bacterium]
MFLHHVKVAIRNIIKHKGTSLINIFGMAVGMACAVLIFFWVEHQMSYDRDQANRDQIYRLETSWVILPPYLKDTVSVFPEVEEAVRFYFWNEPTLQYGEKIFTLTDLAMVDDGVFDVFNFHFLAGDPKSALGKPNSLVLTKSIADRLFGDEEPLGKTLQYNRTISYTVTGVIEDIRKFHLKINAFASVFDIVRRGADDFLKSHDYNFPIYLKITPGADINALEEKINTRVNEQEEWDDEPLFLRPFNNIYFTRNLVSEKNMRHGNKNLVIVFSIIAVLILSIACINFVNLTIAKTNRRFREIAVRKVSGASQSILLLQFFGETFLLVFISFAAALLLVALFFPALESLVGERMVLTLQNPALQLILAAILLFTVFLAGVYPSFHLAALHPATILKGKSGEGRKRSDTSKALVAFQFAISIFLIISMLTVVRQLHYMQDRDLGVDYDRILTCQMRGEHFNGNADAMRSSKTAFKQRLLTDPAIRRVSFLTQPPGKLKNTWTVSAVKEGEIIPIKVFNADPDFVDLLGLEIKDGRNHSYDQASEQGVQFIINEEAVRKLNLTDPVGKTLNSGHITIIGVVNDFHYNSLHTRIEPMAIRWFPEARLACIKIAGSDLPAAIRHIERVYK